MSDEEERKKAEAKAKEIKENSLKENVSCCKLDLVDMFGSQCENKNTHHEAAEKVIEFCKKNQQVLFANIGPFYLEKDFEKVSLPI